VPGRRGRPGGPAPTAATLRTELLVPTATVTHSPSRGDAHHFTVKAGDRSAEDAALRYIDSPIAELRGLVRLDWDAMDGWFEEDEEVRTSPGRARRIR
jgi:uncharacterized protein (DUF427 family)